MTTIIRAAVSGGMYGTAQFSEGLGYRYQLTRSPVGITPDRTVCWVMLNPSSADEKVLEPTLRRCWGYSKAWGYERMIIVNLFGLRATMPRDLLYHADPVGPDNDRLVLSAVEPADRVVLAWGSHKLAKRQDRVDLVYRIAALSRHKPVVLGFNDDDQPRHPLYVPKDAEPVEYLTGRPVAP
jgi:hypothetical protein